MAEKIIDIRGRFHEELSNIDYILTNLENGRVYGHNGNYSQGDGGLAHNAAKLRKEIASLLNKIEYGKDSTSEEIGNALFGKKDE